jgi:hypothetical protein
MATPNIRLIRDASLYHLYINEVDVWLTKSELEELEQIIITCK